MELRVDATRKGLLLARTRSAPQAVDAGVWAHLAGLGAISLGWVAEASGYRGSFLAGSLAAAIGMAVLLRA